MAIEARPNSWGPDYMRFGLSLQDDFEGNSTYNAAVRFVVSDVTRNAGEWVTGLPDRQHRPASTELFLPLAPFSGWFVMPHVQTLSRDVDVLMRTRTCRRVPRPHLQLRPGFRAPVRQLG
jgi:NTE family protein